MKASALGIQHKLGVDVMPPVALVTGAASGIGDAVCKRLIDKGFKVIGLDINGPRLPATGVEYKHFDVTIEQSWIDLSQSSDKPYAVINAAGIAMRQGFDSLDTESWMRALAVNLTGPMFSLKYLSPTMDSGVFINIGSVAALSGHAAVAYTTSKWALRGLTHSAANLLGSRGLRVNIVHPGYIETPLMAEASTKFKQAHLANTPLGRTGTAEEVAALVAFLAGADAQYINGAEISIDGGFASSGGTKFIADSLKN